MRKLLLLSVLLLSFSCVENNIEEDCEKCLKKYYFATQTISGINMEFVKQVEYIKCYDGCYDEGGFYPEYILPYDYYEIVCDSKK